jgi:hypothetical protein
MYVAGKWMDVQILLQVITASWTPRKWGTRDDGFKQGH